MDRDTILASLEFSRARTLGLLDTIQKSGEDMQKVLAWRPAPGRAHIGWQAMHLAATHDRYFNERLQGKSVLDAALVKNFAGGSTPADTDVPTMASIREELEKHFAHVRKYVNSLSNADLDRQIDFPNNVKRTVGESLILMAWHEAHHQGQIHLTWNLYKAAHGVK